MEIVLQVLLLAIGFILLVKGSDWFVDGSVRLAERFKIPQLVIGLTIVSMGTSMPEAAVSISAAIKGNADITIGNIMGSNILNILIILGLSAIVSNLTVEISTIRYELPFLILTTALLFIQGLNGTIGLADGILLLLLFLLYLAYLFFMADQDAFSHRKGKLPFLAPKTSAVRTSLAAAQASPASVKKNPDRQKPWLSPLLTVLGLVLIVTGSSITVEAASSIARAVGISERFIGLTIIALGTSLPELFTSVTAARKGNADIAIGNIVGSNLFNLLFVIGVSALVTPVPYRPAFRFDNLSAGAAALLLLLCCIKERRLLRRHGILMLFGYAVYFIMLL